MNAEQFDQALREFKHRKPFIPFVVEMLNGHRVVIDSPALAFGGGVAGFLSETEGLVDFSFNEVRSMSFVTTETKV